MLVFTHIPKCAGNAVNTVIDPLRRRGKNILALAGAASKLHAEIDDVLAQHAILLSSFDVVTGHLAFSAAKHWHNTTFATLLRDPVERALSDFYSQPSHKNGVENAPQVLSQWYEDRNEATIDNLQVRMLADDPKFGEPATDSMLEQAKRNLVRRYSLVGTVENIDPFVAALQDFIDLPRRPVATVNATWSYQPTEADRAIAREHNELDICLYEWAQNLAPRTKTAHSKIVVGPNVGVIPVSTPKRKSPFRLFGTG